MKKKILSIFLFVILIVPIFAFCGCSSGSASIFITKLPNKIAYKIGETFSSKGLVVESLNTDGTTTKQSISDNDLSKVDTSTAGEKVVTITKNGHNTVFYIYVANVVLTPSDNVKQAILNANNNDVIYFTQGEYKVNDNNKDLSDIVINKKLFLVGDGKDKSVINGNFIVGAQKNADEYTKIENFEGVKFARIGFKQSSKVVDKIITFNSNIGNKNFGAITAFDTSNLYVSDCSFTGFTHGIIMDNAVGLSVVRCNFKDLLLSGITVNKNIKNATIFKNVFTDIGKNVVYVKDDKQQEICMLNLGFNQKGNAGVIISKNTFTRMAQHEGDFRYFDEQSNQLNLKNLSKLSYMNNSCIVLLFSAGEKNLQSSGVILSSNNYGVALTNIKVGKDENTQINQSGIIINEEY